MPGGILALDLATRVGWAWADADDYNHGVHVLPSTGQEVGRFLLHFEYWLAEMIYQLKVSRVVFETPFVSGKTHQRTARKLDGLAGITEKVCCLYDIRCEEVNVSTYRKHFTGTGGRRADMKRRVIEACRARGLSPQDDNDADALALLDYALHKTGAPVPWAGAAV